MKTRNQKTPWSKKIIGIVATVALACMLLPIGAIIAFGDSEAIMQALKVVQGQEGTLAEDVETEGVDNDADGDTDSDEPADTDAEEETDADESETPDTTVDEDELSDAAKAFVNTYDQILAAQGAEDADAKAQLAEHLDTAVGLYAMMSEDEQGRDDIAAMWAQIQSLRQSASDAVDPTETGIAIGDTGYESLQAAVNAAQEGDTIVITKPLELDAFVSFDKNVTLDLNGNDLSVSSAGAFIKEGDVVIQNGNINFSGDNGAYAFSVAGGSLTIDDATLTSASKSGVEVTGGTFAANNTTITCENGYGVRVAAGANATISGGTITAKNGVFVANENSTFTMTGGEIIATDYGIVGNGLSENCGTTINISGDAKVTSTNFIAIYQPQSGELNITGGTFTGKYGAIGIKSGTLNISGGTFEGTNGEEYVDFGSIGNGIMVWGSAIHVDSHSAYADEININITGGTFISANGYAIHEVSNGGSHIASVNISGGSFNTAVDAFRLESASADVVTVTGGTFNHMIPEQYRPGYNCNEENGVFTVTTDLPSHEEHEWNGGVVTVEPTCVTPGVMTYTCNKGGETHDVVITAKGHKHDEGKVTTAATCEGVGVMTYTCEDCGLAYTEEIPALEHIWSEEMILDDADCENDGISYHKCLREGCFEEEYSDILAKGHIWSEEMILDDADCENDGISYHKCLREGCFEEEYSDIHAKGHVPELRGYVEAMCSAEGYTGDDVCTVCNKVVTAGSTISMTEHNEGLEGVVTPATCTHEGSAVFSCVDCGAVTRSEVIPMLEHNVVIDAAVEPTCTAAGLTEGRHCQDCNTVLNAQQEIVALGHAWDEGVITKAATCSATGVKTLTCTRCSITGEEELAVDPNAHSWGAWTVTKVAAAGVEGSEQHVCAHNGAHVETRTIPALAVADNGGAVNAGGNVAGGEPATGAGATEAIADDQTPLAANATDDAGTVAAQNDETIADDGTPMASASNIAFQNAQSDSIDWLIVVAAIAAFVIIDGIVLGIVLARRRKAKLED